MSSEAFKDAQKFTLRFGEHKDSTIDQIAESDKGLRYLDWLRDQTWLRDPLKTHLANYLSDPAIKKELENLT